MAAKKKAPASRGELGQSKAAAAERERLFVEAYIANGGNGTQAAVTAGFSPRTASQLALKLLKRPSVQAALRSRQDALARRHELTTESVIAELSKIVHADPRKLFTDTGQLKPMHEWPDEIAGAVASVEVEELFEGQGRERTQIGFTKKVKLWDKNSGIDKAMKYLGLFEKDNAQRAGALADLPRDMIAAIVDRLKQMNGNGRPA